MKLFIAFLLGCFMVGTLLWSAPTKRRIWAVIGLGLLASFGYYFMRQI